MARTTDQPRLSKLDPAEVASSILRVLVNHTHRVSRLVWREYQPSDTGQLDHELKALVEFAQGKPRAQRLDLYEHLTIWLTLNLFTSAWEARDCDVLQASHPGSKIYELSWDEPVGVLLKACLARLTLIHDERLRIADLAVLAEVTPDHIRLLMRRGTLPPERRGFGSLTPFTAPVARAFLRQRGVSGIRDELRPGDRVALLRIDRIYSIPLFSERDAPQHGGEKGFVLDVQVDATAECRVHLDSGEVVSVKPRWLSKIEPLDPRLQRLLGKYVERSGVLWAP